MTLSRCLAVILLGPLACGGGDEPASPDAPSGTIDAASSGIDASDQPDAHVNTGPDADLSLTCEGPQLTPEQATSALLGIYDITAWSKNTSGCDGDGPSILADQLNQMLWLDFDASLGCLALKEGHCVNLNDCRTSVQASTLIGNMTFEAGSDSAGWTGEVAECTFVGYCFGTLFERTLTNLGGGQIRIEITSTQVSYERPEDANGNPLACHPSQVKDHLDVGICYQKEVIVASFVEALP